jgi:hypothetical protein
VDLSSLQSCAHSSPPPLAGTPKEAIKDTTPATVTADDDAELLEAEHEGGATEAVTKTKHKTKAVITNLIQKTGKKMAGFRGDVSVDGAKKHVSSALACCIPSPSSVIPVRLLANRTIN